MDKPWESEPDYAAWHDADTGLQCLIKRHAAGGHLCGYVAVSDRHPLYRADCDDPRVQSLDVHGGITYAGSPQPHRWWLGFDCAHLGDLSPRLPREFWWSGAVYRTFDYVREQCRQLARQIAAMA